MTWGYALGDRRTIPHDTYSEMQRRLAEGYSKLGAEVGARVAPAGLAWAEALRRKPALDLWAADGQHPGRNGSYLAACLFYAALTGRDPTRAVSQPASRVGRLAFSNRSPKTSTSRTSRAAPPSLPAGVLTPVVRGLARTLKIKPHPADGG